jgi:hypothetical protein
MELHKLRREVKKMDQIQEELDASNAVIGTFGDKETHARKVRSELLNRISDMEGDLLNMCKVMDLVRDYDPEGLSDMERLYEEIEGLVTLSEFDLRGRLNDFDRDWSAKKKAMSDHIKSMFDGKVSLEQKRLRLERAASYMWAMHPGTTRKERALMTSLHDLDAAKKKTGRKDGSAYDSRDLTQERQQHLFARMLESEAGLGLLPSAKDGQGNGLGSASFRRRAYDHARTVRVEQAAKKVAQGKKRIKDPSVMY